MSSSITRETQPAASADDETGRARARIDELDAKIIALVQERRAASARPHAEGRGGLAREMAILERYRRELGRPGTQLAMTLLGLCRGQL